MKIQSIPRSPPLSADEKLEALLKKDPKTLTHQDFMFLMHRALAEMDKINAILENILSKASPTTAPAAGS